MMSDDSCKNQSEGLTVEEQLKSMTGLRRSTKAEVACLDVQKPGRDPRLLTSIHGQLPCALYLREKSPIFCVSTCCQVTFTAILPANRLKDTLSGGPHRTDEPDFLSFKQNSPKENCFFIYLFFGA